MITGFGLVFLPAWSLLFLAASFRLVCCQCGTQPCLIGTGWRGSSKTVDNASKLPTAYRELLLLNEADRCWCNEQCRVVLPRLVFTQPSRLLYLCLQNVLHSRKIHRFSGHFRVTALPRDYSSIHPTCTIIDVDLLRSSTVPRLKKMRFTVRCTPGRELQCRPA